MDHYRWGRWSCWAVVASVGLLHTAIYFWPENPLQPDFFVVAVHDAQLLTAIVLINGWVVLGPAPLWVRLVTAPIFVGLWFLPWNQAMLPREVTPRFMEIYYCAAAVLMCGLRLSGFRIAKRSLMEGRERAPQFSLQALVFATTTIAIAIGFLEWIRPTLSAFGPWRGFPPTSHEHLRVANSGQETRQLVMSIAAALAALGGIASCLRPGSCWLRVAAMATVVASTAIYLAHLSAAAKTYVGLSKSTLLVSTAMSLGAGLAAIAIVSGLSILPLRLSGYRLRQAQRKSRLAEPEEVDAADFHWSFSERLTVLTVIMIVLAVAVSRPLPMDSWNFAAFSAGVAFDRGTNRVQPPLSSFGKWIREGSVDTRDERVFGTDIFPYLGGSRPHRFIDGSMPDIEGVVGTPAETPLLEPTEEQKAEIQQRLAR